MAFKILDSDEISLLNDEQRIQYEKEFELYQQRTEFVERIEILENVQIEPYEPKLMSIHIIEEKEIKNYKKPEYLMSLCEPVEALSVEIDPYKKIEKKMPEVPFVPECTNVRIGYMQKRERRQAHLPTIMHPSLKKNLDLEQLKSNLDYAPNSIPNVVMPDIDIEPFTVSTKIQPELPEVASCAVEIQPFIKPQNNVDLPSVGEPILKIKLGRELEPIQPKVPEIPVSAVLPKVEFHRLEQRKINLPEVEEFNLNTISFAKPECAVKDLPHLLPVSVQTKKFIKPKQDVVQLPMTSIGKVSVVKFEQPKRKGVDVPHVAGVNIERKFFDKPEEIHTKMVAPTIPGIKVNTFKKPGKNNVTLPKININDIPDAYARMDELLSCAK